MWTSNEYEKKVWRVKGKENEQEEAKTKTRQK
jgi:hypothetical protein